MKYPSLFRGVPKINIKGSVKGAQPLYNSGRAPCGFKN